MLRFSTLLLTAAAAAASTGASAIPKVKHIQDKMLLNGKFVPSTSGKTFEVYNPATEEVIAHVSEADAADVDLAVKAARGAFRDFRCTDGSYRRNLMYKLADLIAAHKEELAALESLDNGKPYVIALNADVAYVEECFRFYAGVADKIYGEVAPTSGNTLTYVKREPVGVCGQIIPWNFPLLMAAWKLAPALATGNTVILKPAEQTPLSALRLGELIQEAGYPSGVVNILPGFGGITGSAIASHHGIDKVAFTGSTVIGREVMKMAAESNLKKVSLELGGKSPLIICDDVDVQQAAKVASKGIYFNVGQVCTASSRMYVHEKVHDAFVEALKQNAERHRVGNGLDLDTDMGPLVSKKQHKRVLDYIKAGKEEGATLVTGGERLGDKGYFVKPTIFTNVKEDMKICKEEIFGPVTCIMKFKDLDEVIERANASIYGLAAGICTRNLDIALRYSSYLEAGVVWVNDWNNLDQAAPFGGIKQSGFGRELSMHVLDLYTNYKTVLFNLNGNIVKPETR